jgi:hypothetical protein
MTPSRAHRTLPSTHSVKFQRVFATLIVACLVLIGAPRLSAAQDQPITGDAVVTARPAVAVREAPSKSARRLGILRTGTPIQIIESSPRGLWIRVTDGRNLTGWVARRHVALGRPVNVTVQPDATSTLPVEPAPQPASPLRTGSRTRQIFARGQALGNRANVFSVVGDSLTTVQPFLTGFGAGGYALGGYGNLQATIDYFSVPPREGIANSFTHQSKAATLAFNAAAALDPTWLAWTDRNSQCAPNEQPIACEYRLMKPSVAIILLGPEDLQIYDATAFQAQLSRIVALSIDNGVIPVLTTFPTAPIDGPLRQGEQFNNVIRGLAATYGVPLIELRDSAMQLPAYGVKEDGFHLSDYGPAYGLNQSTAQMSGCALRNLYTLQMLDLLRRNVLQA